MATRNFQLYGSSPDQLAQQQQNYDRFFYGADERNVAAAERAAQFNLQNFLNARAQDEAARNQDMKTRLGLWQYGNEQNQQRENIDYTRGEDRRRFDINLGLKREDLANDRLRIGEFEKREKNKQADIDAQNQESFALTEAEEGMITDEAQVLKKYPSISKESAKYATDRSKAVRAMIDTEFKKLEDAAEKLNAAARLKRQIQGAERAIQDDPGFETMRGWNPLNYTPAGYAFGTVQGQLQSRAAMRAPKSEIKSSLAKLYGDRYVEGREKTIDPSSISQIEERLLGNKEIKDQLIIDPTTGEYKAPPRPTWLQPKPETMTKLLKEAEDAIRAGADPVKVRERIARLGSMN